MQEERGVGPRKILLRVALLLAIASAVTMPAVAQASPKFFENGVKLTTLKQGLINYGKIELTNPVLHNIVCENLASGFIWNESEKALFITEGYTTYDCEASPTKCPGVFATAEMPVEVSERLNSKSEKEVVAQRGPTTLPWSGEAVEVTEGVEKLKKIKTHGIKVTIVAPCFSLEVPFEGELEPIAVNGSKNGLKASEVVFEGEGGKTNHLVAPSLPAGGQNGYTIGRLHSVGTSVQLITLGE
jgi:hypothetical protein